MVLAGTEIKIKNVKMLFFCCFVCLLATTARRFPTPQDNCGIILSFPHRKSPHVYVLSYIRKTRMDLGGNKKFFLSSAAAALPREEKKANEAKWLALSSFNFIA